MSSTPQHASPPILLADRYEVLSSLGSGAAANVFRVRDRRTGVVRAAKVLKPENAAKPGVLARFEDEFRILRTLHHPHLPEVYDYGWTDEGGRFLVMELVDGEPLDAHFRAHPEDIWVVLYELCETLTFIHAHSLLHQDIKPSNILVKRTDAFGGEKPLVKLIDFGLTHRRDTGASVQLVGTAAYMAPEVIRGEAPLTRAVDYYSLGITLFELLSGAPPFAGTENEVLRAHLSREPLLQEQLEWAELYPHVRALLTKDGHTRLEAFEEFRRAVVSRLTGGIDELDRAYGLARIDSLGMIGKSEAWGALKTWLAGMSVSAPADGAVARTMSLVGGAGWGKSYLVDELRAEAALRDVRLITPRELIGGRAQPATIWASLAGQCKTRPVVLAVDEPESLTEEERAFARFAGTQWELARSHGHVLPLYFLVVRDLTSDGASVLPYLPLEGSREIDMSPLSPEHRDAVIDRFRGSMFDSRDVRALSTFLSRVDSAGGAVQALQRAVLQAGLTFTGQRWKAHPSVLGEIDTASHADALSRDLLASFSSLERRVAVLLAVHIDPVPVSWAAEFAKTDPAAVAQLASGRMKRFCVVSRDHDVDCLGFVGNTLKAAIAETAPVIEAREAREFLIERVEDARRASSSVDPRLDQQLAAQYQQLGMVREAARVHLRLLRAYWAVRPRQRSYESIENVCRSGLKLLETHGDKLGPGSRRHLFCFYLKQWVEALWARNFFAQAKPVIEEWTKRLDQDIPVPLLPRYVRALNEADGPDAALAVLVRLKKSAGAKSHQLELRLELERSLCLHNKGEYRAALKVLDKIEVTETLCLRDRYRLQIYRAMYLEETGRALEARRLLTSLVERAEKDSCFDEAVLMRAFIARGLLGSGRVADSLSEIAAGLRLTHTNGLHFRENLMYRLAASAFGDMGRFRRVRTCHENALQLAGALGIPYLTGTSWARLAMNERISGRYGNALRYAERAIDFIGEDGPDRDRNQALLSLYAVHVLLRTPDRAHHSRALARRMGVSGAPNDRGHYDSWLGLDLLYEGKAQEALEAFCTARARFELAGFSNNALSATLKEARVHLSKRDQAALGRTIRDIETGGRGWMPDSFLFELSIVRLKELYLWRRPWPKVAEAVRECETYLAGESEMALKIEALQIIFRAYARHGMADAAERTLATYRDLVAEMVANVDTKYSRDLAVALEVDAMLSASRVMKRGEMPGGRLADESPSMKPSASD